MNASGLKAWLFTTHYPTQIFSGYKSIDPVKDLLVAVDGGLAGLHSLGLTPDMLIGDFDSVPEELLQSYMHCLQMRHPATKDETDTELAILWALEQGARQIVICNDFCGRSDHALALIQNLDHIRAQGCSGSIESATQRLFFLDEETQLNDLAGCGLSLLAWSEDAEFLSSDGLLYPLAGVILTNLRPRGMSNNILSTSASIGMKRGKVMAIVSKPNL